MASITINTEEFRNLITKAITEAYYFACNQGTVVSEEETLDAAFKVVNNILQLNIPRGMSREEKRQECIRVESSMRGIWPHGPNEEVK